MSEDNPAVDRLELMQRRGFSEPVGGGRASKAKRPRAATQRRREEIVKAASKTFAMSGYRGSSLAEIADEVGMTHAGVLHHFGSKERLLTEVLAYRDQSDLENYEDGRAPRGRDFLKHLLGTVDMNASRPGLVQVYTVLSGESVTNDHPAKPWFVARYVELRETLKNALVEAHGTKALPSDEELNAATVAIIATMDGLQLQWLLDPGAVDMSAAVELVIDSILAKWGLSLDPDEADNADSHQGE